MVLNAAELTCLDFVNNRIHPSTLSLGHRLHKLWLLISPNKQHSRESGCEYQMVVPSICQDTPHPEMMMGAEKCQHLRIQVGRDPGGKGKRYPGLDEKTW